MAAITKTAATYIGWSKSAQDFPMHLVKAEYGAAADMRKMWREGREEPGYVLREVAVFTPDFVPEPPHVNDTVRVDGLLAIVREVTSWGNLMVEFEGALCTGRQQVSVDDVELVFRAQK